MTLDKWGIFIGEPIPENKLFDLSTIQQRAPVKIAEIVSTLETKSLVITPNLDRICAVYPQTLRFSAPYPSRIEMAEQGIERVASGFIGGENDDYFYRITEEKAPIKRFSLEKLRELMSGKESKHLKLERINRSLLRYSDVDKLATNFFIWTGTYEELVDEVMRDINEVSLSRYGKSAIIDI